MQGILPLFSKKRDPRDKPEDDEIAGWSGT